MVRLVLVTDHKGDTFMVASRCQMNIDNIQRYSSDVNIVQWLFNKLKFFKIHGCPFTGLARHATFRCAPIPSLLSIATYIDYEIWQMDIKIAFLNGSLEETIYMVQPQGFITNGQESKVCKLQKSIYGLKQASRSWNIKFDQSVKTFGFI